MMLRIFGKILFAAFVILWVLVALNATAQPAYAYVDPGSGLLLFQIVGSTFAGMTFLLRKNIRRFFASFGRHSQKEGNDVAGR
jgi:hypothetical protein